MAGKMDGVLFGNNNKGRKEGDERGINKIPIINKNI